MEPQQLSLNYVFRGKSPTWLDQQLFIQEGYEETQITRLNLFKPTKLEKL